MQYVKLKALPVSEETHRKVMVPEGITREKDLVKALCNTWKSDAEPSHLVKT